jgi:hypothetical protein
VDIHVPQRSMALLSRRPTHGFFRICTMLYLRSSLCYPAPMRSHGLAMMLMVLLASCGRLEFDLPMASIAAQPDAAPVDSRLATDPLYQYSFNGNLLEDFGGPPLVSLGGTLGNTFYQFSANQGLLADAKILATPEYTIDIVFSFDQFGGYQKIVDFRARSADAGLYTFGASMKFLVVTNQEFYASQATIPPATEVQFTLTRNSAGTVIGYINRLPQITFLDDKEVAVSKGNAIHFFIDDNLSNVDAGSGRVERIRIYDLALRADQIGL